MSSDYRSKINTQAAQISKLQEKVETLGKTPRSTGKQSVDFSIVASKVEVNTLLDRVEELTSTVLETRKRSFDAAKQSNTEDASLAAVYKASWEREMVHSDLANKRIDEDRFIKMEK